MKNNFDYLIEQFKKAKGIKKNDIYSKEFMQAFSHWLNQMQIIGNEYKYYLESLELNYKNSDCVEFGKGEHDTIVKPYETRIISNNTSEITGVEKERLIKGNVQFDKGSAYLHVNVKKELGATRLISNLQVSTFMTQNPYSFKSINGIEKLHNGNKFNIILGVYGSVHDKDMPKKIECLTSIKEQLVGNYISEYDTFDDAYYYIVASNNSNLKLKKR